MYVLIFSPLHTHTYIIEPQKLQVFRIPSLPPQNSHSGNSFCLLRIIHLCIPYFCGPAVCRLQLPLSCRLPHRSIFFREAAVSPHILCLLFESAASLWNPGHHVILLSFCSACFGPAIFVICLDPVSGFHNSHRGNY